MGKSTDTIDILVRHFNRNKWPQDVTIEKLQTRFGISNDDALPLWDVVEIERHRPILGTNYTSGLAMAAFETYYMRYGVNVSTSEVRELPERSGEIKIDSSGIAESDLSADSFSLSVEAIDATNYLIRESTSGEHAQVTSFYEVREFALTLSDQFVDYFYETLDREFSDHARIDRAKRTEILSSYEKSLKEKISALAKRAWEDREPWEK